MLWARVFRPCHARASVAGRAVEQTLDCLEHDPAAPLAFHAYFGAEPGYRRGEDSARSTALALHSHRVARGSRAQIHVRLAWAESRCATLGVGRITAEAPRPRQFRSF